MERDEIRLECLKLRIGYDRTPAEIVASAKILEDYVTGDLRDEPVPEPKKGHASKKTGNP